MSVSTIDKMTYISEGNGSIPACGLLSSVIEDTQREFVIQLMTSDDTGSFLSHIHECATMKKASCESTNLLHNQVQNE